MSESTPLAALQAVADRWVEPATPTRTVSATNGTYQSRLDVPRWLTDRGIEYREKQSSDKTIYSITCPFNPDHVHEANVSQFADGRVGASCFHASCSGRGWQEFKDAIGRPDGNHYDPPLKSAGPQAAAQREQLPAGARVYAQDRGNWGTVVSDDGDTITVHFVNPHDGNEADINFEPRELRRADGTPVDPASVAIVKTASLKSLVEAHPQLRMPVIDGLLRKGEVANLIAKSKVGKSWLTYSIALSVVSGKMLFEKFRYVAGRVLIIDNELHAEVLADRLPQVIKAAGRDYSEVYERIELLCLRGRLMSIADLGPSLAAIERDRFSLIILDALYRMLPAGASENDNAAMAQVYNLLDSFAEMTGAAIMLVHHASKGDQSGKDITDVGSGAGSQSRAADTHLILRPHQEEACVVLDAAVRSFAPVESLALRWEFPLWRSADDLDPAALKRSATRQDERQAANDREGFAIITDALRQHGSGTAREIRKWTGFGADRANRLLARMTSDGRLISKLSERRGSACEIFTLDDHLQPANGRGLDVVCHPSRPLDHVGF